jgi:hypothetical protein
MGAELLGEHAGNSFDGAFRRDVLMMLPPSGAEVLQHLPGRQQNSEHVGVEVPMEVLLRHLLGRCELVARVVDEDINRPEGAFRLDEQASDITPLGKEPWR